MVVSITENRSPSSNPKKPKTFFYKNKAKSISRTQQGFADECNINCIMEKINRHMVNHNVNTRKPVYGDFSNVPDYAESMNKNIAVKNSFNALPAKVRARFENDPEKLLVFMDNPENIEEGRKLGIIPKDMSYIKYVNDAGDDITDDVFATRGVYSDGVRVNRDGTPYIEEGSTPPPELPSDSPNEDPS